MNNKTQNSSILTLDDYFEAVKQNQTASINNKKPEYELLNRLDKCFITILEGWTNPKDLISPLFFCRCHSAFRVACGNALAGQASDMCPQIRICLEYAGYALHLYKNPNLVDVWVDRHENPKSMKLVKKEFQISSIKATIRGFDRHGEKVFDKLYNDAIDFGGHPNERSVTSNLIISNHDQGKAFEQIYLHGDGISLDYGFKSLAQTGVCVLEIFQNIFKARFELLGVRSELLDLRKGL